MSCINYMYCAAVSDETDNSCMVTVHPLSKIPISFLSLMLMCFSKNTQHCRHLRGLNAIWNVIEDWVSEQDVFALVLLKKQTKQKKQVKQHFWEVQ